MIIFKIICILLIIILFYLIINKNIEKFINEDFSNNTNDLISSSMPYDIKCKDKKITYYDYSNNEFEEKIKILFNINNILDIIYYIEGNEWNQWTNPTKELTKKYYNKIIDYINTNLKLTNIFDLPNDKSKIRIIKKNFIRYKKNKNNNNLLLDIDIVFYRYKKPLGKHFKFFIIIDNNNIKFLYTKLSGVINEFSLNSDEIKSNNIYDNYHKLLTNNNINIKNNKDPDYVLDDNEINTIIEKNIFNNLSYYPSDFIELNNNEKFTKEMIDIRNKFLHKLKS